MERTANIAPFINGEGKITKLPKKQAVRRAVLAYIAERFEFGRRYTEPQINALCQECHTFGDVFLLRRELVDHGFLRRTPDGAAYWRSPEALPTEAATFETPSIH